MMIILRLINSNVNKLIRTAHSIKVLMAIVEHMPEVIEVLAVAHGLDPKTRVGHVICHASVTCVSVATRSHGDSPVSDSL